AYRALAVEDEVLGDVEVTRRGGVFAGTGDRERDVPAEDLVDDDRVGARERVRLLDRGAYGALVGSGCAHAVPERDVDRVRRRIDGEGRAVCDLCDDEQ